MFCHNCGQTIDDKAVICPHCGVSQRSKGDDTGGFWWSILGCCIPIVGLILFLVWNDSKPNTAKAAGIGALISVLGPIIFWILVAFIGAIFGI